MSQKTTSSGVTISNTSLSVGKFSPHRYVPIARADPELSLEKEQTRRATPWRMLEHPWMVEVKGKKVSMSTFLKKVWEWQD
jgi:hypothetical protein